VFFDDTFMGNRPAGIKWEDVFGHGVSWDLMMDGLWKDGRTLYSLSR
jgi:hypothetical protein